MKLRPGRVGTPRMKVDDYVSKKASIVSLGTEHEKILAKKYQW